ncbi:oxidoreductase nitrogenase component 1 [Clostridia bacterium]|nr:oxidoreductase nitrogenase component 1 [Clostridia bacterium]
MSYIEERVAPRREERLGSCIEYGGTVGEVHKKFCGGCMKNKSRSFSQGTICQLLPAIAILTSLQSTVVLVHGAVGCGGVAHFMGQNVRFGQFNSGDKNPKGALWLSTNLKESDVVSGGEGKLKRAILAADTRYRPDAIVVVSTCIPGIIGDDIDGVVNELQEATSATLLPIHCEGFKTKIMASAYDAIFHSFLRNVVDGVDETEFSVYDNDAALAKEKIRRSRLVNLLNVSSMTGPDQQELTRLLNKLGLEVNMLPCDAHPDAFRLAPFAALSIGVCPTHDDYFMTYLEEKFGVPFVGGQMPIGIENTSIWLRQIAEKLGLSEAAERIIKSETEELNQALKPLLPHLTGKSAMLSAGEIRTFATAVLLQEFGMEILAVRPYHYDEFGGVEVEKLEKVNPGIRVNVATAQPFEAVNILKRAKPDLYIGHNSDNVWAAKCGVPVLPIYGTNSIYSGYAGAYDIARRIKRHFTNTIFNKKLEKNVRQPYRDNWYGEDPFKYIKAGEF